MDFNGFINAAILAMVAIIGYFLRQKDAAQEKQITALWEKHDDDANKLEALRLQIASEHYVKRELDEKFDRLSGLLMDYIAKK